MKAGWATKAIGEVCAIVNGGTPKTGVADYWDGDHLWITPAEMGKRRHPYVNATERRLTDAGLANSSARLLPPNSVILSSRAPIGHLVINTAPMATNQGCKGLIPNKALDHKFLFHYLAAKVTLLNDLGTGATFKELSGGKLKEVPIPIPPLSEQRRIVAILDEAFAGLEAMRANTERSLQNARELFENALDGIFREPQSDWIEAKLGDVCQFENGDRGSNYPNRSEYVERGIPWINTGHIQPDGTLSQSEMNFITREKFETLRSGKIRPGDIVYCLRGATLGKTAIVEPFKEGAVASSLVIIRPKEALDQRFLYFFLSSPHGQSLVRHYENGAAQPNLGAKSVAKFAIAIPALHEQKEIVERISGVRAETQRLESIYRDKLAAIDQLKQSILQKAFSGELTSAESIAA